MSSLFPETESRLIRDLQDPRNDEAWGRFDQLYRPLVMQFARRQGLSAADADEVAADVMRRVARAADRWSRPSDPAEPPRRFAPWLRRVARNCLVNLVTREIARRSSGGTSNWVRIQNRVAPCVNERELWDAEEHKTLFLRATSNMKSRWEPAAFDVFWRSHVLGHGVEQVSETTGKSTGAIYAIRSRAVKWLKEEVKRLQAFDDHDEDESRGTPR